MSATDETRCRPPAPSARCTAAQVRDSSPEEVDAAVRSAYDARGRWRRTAPLRACGVPCGQPRLPCGAVGRAGRLAVRDDQPVAARGAGSRPVVAADLLDEAAVTGLGVAGRTLAGAPGAMDVVRAEPRGVVAVLTPVERPVPGRGRAGRGGARHRQHRGAQAVGAKRRTGRADGRADRRRACPRGCWKSCSGGGEVGAQLAGGRPRGGRRARRQQRDRPGDQRRGRGPGRTGAAGERRQGPDRRRRRRRPGVGGAADRRPVRSPTPASCARRWSASTCMPTSPRP